MRIWNYIKGEAKQKLDFFTGRKKYLGLDPSGIGLLEKEAPLEKIIKTSKNLAIAISAAFSITIGAYQNTQSERPEIPENTITSLKYSSPHLSIEKFPTIKNEKPLAPKKTLPEKNEEKIINPSIIPNFNSETLAFSGTIELGKKIHTAIYDSEIGGIKVPKGMKLFARVDTKNRNPNDFPEIYKTEAFSGEFDLIKIPENMLTEYLRLAVKDGEGNWKESIKVKTKVSAKAEKQKNNVLAENPQPEKEKSQKIPKKSIRQKTGYESELDKFQNQNIASFTENKCIFSGNEDYALKSLEEKILQSNPNLTASQASQNAGKAAQFVLEQYNSGKAAYKLTDTYAGIDNAKKVDSLIAFAIKNGGKFKTNLKKITSSTGMRFYDHDIAVSLYAKEVLAVALKKGLDAAVNEATRLSAKDSEDRIGMNFTRENTKKMLAEYIQSQEISIVDYRKNKEFYDTICKNNIITIKIDKNSKYTIYIP